MKQLAIWLAEHPVVHTVVVTVWTALSMSISTFLSGKKKNR